MAHDYKIAVYEIFRTNDDYFLVIKFDKDDLKKSIQTEFKTTHDDWLEFTEQYIRKHFYLKFNDEFSLIRFEGISEERDFIVVDATLNKVSIPVQTIQVFSTCLINETEGQSNLIHADLYGKKRYFRLSNERIKTLIEY